MKLLTKLELNKEKSIERQKEIDEGLKLAKRVDALREIAVAEEASLENFRQATVSAIQADIVAETTKRDRLVSEVRDLEQRRQEALLPLESEFAEVEKQRGELDRKEEELNALIATTLATESRLTAKLKEAEEEAQRATYAHTVAREKTQEAGTLKDEAERLHRIASDKLLKAERESTAMRANIDQRIEWLTEREKAISDKEEELRKKEIDLAKEWTVLQDRIAMHERNLTRNK